MMVRSKYVCDCENYFKRVGYARILLRRLLLSIKYLLSCRLRGFQVDDRPAALERRKVFMSLNALIKRTISKPAYILNWNILVQIPTTDVQGR
ncbi:TPA: hypothetical protein N0F65_011094, partial [Lagenidium giganteum]